MKLGSILKAAPLLLVALLIGCAENKLTRRNYDMIKEGMSNRDEVRLTLGEKYNDRGDNWEFEDEDRALSVVIHFDANGKVVGKEWRDAKTGEWEGAAPGINPNPGGRPVSSESSNTTIKKD